MDEPEEKLVMCLNVEDAGPNFDGGVDGSVKARCSRCPGIVWIAPTGQRLVNREGAKIVCSQCFEKMTKEATPEDPINLVSRADMLKELFDQLCVDAERRGAQPKHLYDFITEFFGRAKVGEPE